MEGYIVTVEVFVPRDTVSYSRGIGTLHDSKEKKKELAKEVVETVLELTDLGYEVKNVRKHG